MLEIKLQSHTLFIRLDFTVVLPPSLLELICQSLRVGQGNRTLFHQDRQAEMEKALTYEFDYTLQ